MGGAPVFASVGEAMEMVQAGLSYLAAADAAQFAAQTQAECLQGLEQAEAVATAARACFLSAFTAGQGYSADADYSVLSWLMHRTGITRGAAVGHTAWARRTGTHPKVLAALAARQVSESVGRMICRWTGQLPEKFRDESDELLIAAAAAGLGLRDLGALFAEMYERARSELPDEDPDGPLEDRALRLVTTFGGAGVLTGDLTPECAAAVTAVLDALSAPAGAEDDPDPGPAVSRRAAGGDAPPGRGGPAAGAGRAAGQGLGAHLPGGPAPAGWQLGPAGGVDRAGPRAVGRAPRRRRPRAAATAGRGWTATPPRPSPAMRRWPPS